MPDSDQGVRPGRYSLIPRTLIFLTRGEHVLLLKGAPHKRLWANQYNGIGGHIERGEGVLAAARRELLEEAGLEADDLRLCGIITIDAGDPLLGIAVFVLTGECPQGEPASSPEGTPEWVRMKDLGDYPQVEDLPALLGRILAMQPGDPPFSAHYQYDEAGKLVITFT